MKNGEWGQVENQQAANTKQQASLPRHRSYESGTGRQASTAKAKAASGRPVTVESEITENRAH